MAFGEGLMRLTTWRLDNMKKLHQAPRLKTEQGKRANAGPGKCEMEDQ